MENLIRKSLKHKNLLFISFVLFTIINISCQKQEIFSHFYEMKDGEWAQNDTLIFDIDSILYEVNKPYALSIEITNNVSYPYRNIWFFIQDNIQNDSIYTHQAIEFQIADEFGKWEGSGFGSLYQVSLPVCDSLIFTERRNYRIKIEHGMRDTSLTGLEKVGIRIQQQEN